MTYDAEELEQYPEIMNKEQLRKVCHISKRTAHYLLQFNLIPHVCTGKKTRCYAIKKRDVIDFMINREINPSRYIVPTSWYEELFMSTEERLDAKKPKVEAIPLADLTPFRNHPFKVKEDEEMAQLMRSIADAGVLSPALARPLPDGGYELISGHRRLAACKALGMGTMPVIIRDLTDEEAVITMVDSNLQREHILPSEKAFAYKMKMEALKNQGKRTDLTLSQVATKLDAAAEIGKSADESRDQVFRYIRLTHLIPDILKLVDEGKIALTPAVELSYLQPSEQEMLFSVMDSDEVTPSLSQARRLRRMSEAQTLTDDAVLQLLSEVKGNQVEYVKVPVDKLRSFFHPDTSVKQMTETLVKAMDFYNKHLARQRKDRDAR